MYVPHLVYPFTCHGHLGCFYVLAIVNRVSVNAGVHVALPIRLLSGYVPGAGLLDHMAALVFSGACILFSIVGSTNLHSWWAF